MKELSKNELMEVEGGWWQAALAALGAIIYVYNNWDDFVAGFEQGVAEANQ
jgi:lactobin A/cerein 7B family class IIb bacteriocin